MSEVKIIFLPEQKEISAPAGTNLLELSALAGVPVEGNCGGKGTCGKCRVRVVEGKIFNPTPPEEKHLSREDLARGWVLACRHRAKENLVVEVPERKDVHLRKGALKWKGIDKTQVDPSVQKIYVSMDPPAIKDQAPDLERLLGRLPRADLKVGRRLLEGLPRTLREAGFKVTAVIIDDRLAAVEPGDTTRRKFGAAFDIGTTTVVGYLLDLNSGEVLAVSTSTNPQNVYGADVISRINHAAGTPGGLKDLQDKILGAVNGILKSLAEEAGISNNEIYEAVVVGNTTMIHLFLGIDPSNLAPAPFIPAFSRPMEASPDEFKLQMNPGGRILTLPNVAGFVGSDTVAVMLATRLYELDGYTLAVDIGTNGEIILAGRGRILTCSTAAGPAFEGSCIKHGMRAAEGAIESVQIGGEVTLGVIGNSSPKGICGSGLIDAAAEMLKAGIVDSTGRFADPETNGRHLSPGLRSRLRAGDSGKEFVLAAGDATARGGDIVITQKDIRELQLAKGAIHAGINILLKEMGIALEEVSRIFLAGAFGNYIKKESALAIGLLPDVSPDLIIPVGNAAGDGAIMSLVSMAGRSRASSLAREADHIELSARPDFQQEFIEALQFPENGGKR